jgi:flagellar biosynthesis protein FlhA
MNFGGVRFGNLSAGIMPVGVLLILAVLLVPLPPLILDLMLTVSITFSVVVLMTVLLIREPLELNSFPSILLVATMIRLALNVASTRLILSDGHEGTEAAGRVIMAFGNFVVAGNYVIGFVVFAILIIINFIVITKGAGRIAEVAARFTLDAMPGKQMAIDADLSSGLVNEDEARERRKSLESESTFYGAMDGASKFVRGDAIAGLLITMVNVVGGIIIGVLQQDMDLSSAAENYTLLTIGDGLVSQFPALIVSTAAGMLVTKTRGEDGSGVPMMLGQLGRYPLALWIVSGLMVAMSIIPQLPAWPFLLMAALSGGFAWHLSRREDMPRDMVSGGMLGGMSDGGEGRSDGVGSGMVSSSEGGEEDVEPVAQALQIDMIRLEMGYGLLPLINVNNELRLTDQIKALRSQLAGDVGFVMPPVRIQDNLQLPANTYVLRIKEIEAGRGDIRPNMLLVMDPRGGVITLPGEATTEPTFGLPATWIHVTSREEAIFRGYTVVDPATVITTHLTEVIKDHMEELLTYAETQNLIDELPEAQRKILEDMVPSKLSLGSIQRVLQNLLAERVSVRDLSTILEGISEACGYTNSIQQITEHVRSRLARQICDSHADTQGVVSLVTLSPEWEQAFIESIVSRGEERSLAMAPTRLQEFIRQVRRVFEGQAKEGENPCLLVSPQIRTHVRSIVERFRPSTVVLSQNEIHPKAKIRTVAQI